MVKQVSTFAGLVFGVLLSVAQASDKNPMFNVAGIVDIVHPGYTGIVINDMAFRLSQNVVIHGEKGNIATRRDLKKGVKVGLNLSSSSGSSGKMAYEVWILPSSYKVDLKSKGFIRPIQSN